MKKVVLMLVAFFFLMTGCGTTGSTNGGANTSEVSEIINEHLGISPYIPEIDHELGAVILEHYMTTQEPFYATINYFESLNGLTAATEEMMKQWKEDFPNRELVYGTLYVEPPIITIDIYPAGNYKGSDGEIINIAGHEVQYSFIQRESKTIFMDMHFDNVSYSIRYSVESDNIEKEAKKLAEDIIKSNS